jgi:transcriptional regulator with XRE-family HTH domain
MRDVNYIMITSDQIRAARGLIRWSARQLAEKAGLSLPTIQRIEAADGIPPTSAKPLDAIQRALEAAGIAFVPENGGGPGVRFRKSGR